MASVSNNTVVSILLPFSSIYGATNAFLPKKLPGRLDDDIINSFLSMCNFLAHGFLAQSTSVCDVLVYDSLF